MSNEKVKFYKNPSRNRVEAHTPYVPQYQLRGIEPEEYKSPLSANYSPPKLSPGSQINPRSPKPHVRQPYAEAIPSPIGRGRGPIPNVGNNIEQTWSSVDGEIIDDISELEQDQTMVDNNEFVSAAALGLPDDSVLEVEEELDDVEEKSFLTENELQNALKEEYTTTVLKQLDEDEYLLLVDGAAICSGPLEHIQNQTKALVFGEHDLYNKNPVSVDDIVVIKRVRIKVGVFLD